MREKIFNSGYLFMIILSLAAFIFIIGTLIGFESEVDSRKPLGSFSGSSYSGDRDKEGEVVSELSTLDKDKIKINAPGTEVVFDSDKEGVSVTDKLEVRIKGNRIYVNSEEEREQLDDQKAVIGSDKNFRLVEIESAGNYLRGQVSTEELAVEGAGVKLDMDLQGRELRVEGAGVELLGKYDVETMFLEGMGVSATVEINNTEQIEMSGMGISGDITYLDTWEGSRSITASGMGGEITVKYPEDNKGNLRQNNEGSMNINVERY
ncbi:MAG: hypothetical protein ACOC5A_02800 [Halanaerobiales bacterium]